MGVLELLLSALRGEGVLVASAAFVAGFMRGLMGFGGAMIFVPATAAVLGPLVAISAIWFFDLVVQAPLVWRALRQVSWKEIGPLAIAAGALTPVGTVFLVLADRDLLRWTISAVVLIFVALMAAGWRAPGAHTTRGRVAVGALAGLVGGAVGMPGPPVILFYLSGGGSAQAIRANLIVFFATLTVVTGLSLWGAGLVTRANGLLALALIVPFSLGAWLGTRAFPYASDKTYRRVAFVLVAGVAVVSLPVLDPAFGR
jgi:uncharacterized protein